MGTTSFKKAFRVIGGFLVWALGGGTALYWAAKKLEEWSPASWGPGLAFPLWAWSILVGSGIVFWGLIELSEQIAALKPSDQDERQKGSGRPAGE